MWKNKKISRTSVIAIVVAAAGLAEAVSTSGLLPDSWTGPTITAIGVVMFWLRTITGEPVTFKRVKP